jgi:DNA-binding response OmpR family regulator
MEAAPRLGRTLEEEGALVESDAAEELRILVVDDDPAVVRLIRATLEDEGFGVASATNGEEALDQLERFPADLIVLDLEMPLMDGPAFFRSLRARGRHTPVLLLSAYGARRARRELGAEGAMEKPFDPQMLGRRIRELLDGTPAT